MCVLSTVWKILFVVSILWTGEATKKKQHERATKDLSASIEACSSMCLLWCVRKILHILFLCTTTNKMLFCMNFSQIHFDRLDLELLPFTSCVFFCCFPGKKTKKKEKKQKKNIPNTTTDKKLEFLSFCHYTCIVQCVLVMIATIDR